MGKNSEMNINVVTIVMIVKKLVFIIIDFGMNYLFRISQRNLLFQEVCWISDFFLNVGNLYHPQILQ
jgi:hypothetical protein